MVIAALLAGSAAQAQAATPLEEARAAWAAGDVAQTETLLAPLTGAEGAEAAALNLMSQVRQRQGKLAEAVTFAERATQLDATKAEYFAQLGVAMGQRMGELTFMQQAMASGKLRKAFAKAVELDPRNVAGLIGLSRFYASAPEIAGGSLDKAAEYARRVKEIAPFQGEMELAGVAERAEQPAEALKHLEAATAINPQQAWAQYRCGATLAQLGRKDEARARFETALKLDPKLTAAQKALTELDAPAAAK